MNDELGTATIPAAALGAVAMLMAMVVADVAGYIAGGVAAATAADAAALAAAPATFRSFGPATTPAQEAERFAVANGASLVACRCRVDRSWRSRTVEVLVARRQRLILFGVRTIRAVGRAEFVPTRLN